MTDRHANPYRPLYFAVVGAFVSAVCDAAADADAARRRLWFAEQLRRATEARGGGFPALHAAMAQLELTLPITPTRLRDAYRKMAKQHHPDVPNRDDATMVKVNAAFAYLKFFARES